MPTIIAVSGIDGSGKLIREMNTGDVLKVVRIDRLARSVAHLLDVVETLARKNAHFRSLRDPIDTTTPQGMFSLHVLGAVAQLERALIVDRCKAGIVAAQARGKVFGNPGVKAGDPVVISRIIQARDKTYATWLVNNMETFMPTVRQLRPQCPWPEVAEAVSGATGMTWTVERLKRSIRRLVAEGHADENLFGRAPRPRCTHTHLIIVPSAKPSSKDRFSSYRMSEFGEVTAKILAGINVKKTLAAD